MFVRRKEKRKKQRERTHRLGTSVEALTSTTTTPWLAQTGRVQVAAMMTNSSCPGTTRSYIEGKKKDEWKKKKANEEEEDDDGKRIIQK